MAPAKPKGTLKAFLDTKKTDSRLLGPIERHLMNKPRDTSRRTDVIHPSELIKADFCVRASYFKIIGRGAEEARPNLRLQNIFDEGHAIHDKWQTRIWEMGNLFGKWLCLQCDHTWFATSPEECEDCHGWLLKYKEIPLLDDDLMIQGHADGWVKGIGDDYMIEIKSIGTGTIRFEQPSLLAANDGDLSKAWRDIRRPFPSHLRQGQLYMELARRMVEVGLWESAPSEMVYLYELKSDQSVKEFVVKADPFVIKDCLDTAYDLSRAVRSLSAPACNINMQSGCKACKTLKDAE